VLADVMRRLSARAAYACADAQALTGKQFVFCGVDLDNDMRRIARHADAIPADEPEILAAAESRRHPVIVRQPEPGASVTVLRQTRLHRGLELLGLALVPKGPFARETVTATDARGLRQMLGQNVPMLYDIELAPPDNVAGTMLGLGRNRVRLLLTSMEASLLTRFCSDIVVHAVWKGREYRTLPDSAGSYVAGCRRSEDPWIDGLVIQALWAATEAGGRVVFAGSTSEPTAPTWAAMWRRARERIEGFMLAIRLEELGCRVLSYGEGRVALGLAEPRAVAWAESNGWKMTADA
jgi:hypothetical protein